MKKKQDKMKKKNNQRIIKIEVPKEIWDAHMSIWNWNRDVFGAWAKSIVGVVNNLRNNNDNTETKSTRNNK